ncbi:Crp/Fnr family transcriptional regulator [Xanthobacter autotrophicus]|uniref:Crp/Fnr family transcriptional regulator n=1 Tax=Xanthobacter TaxID=279 RepID=UPI0024AC06A5|nr:Crp/Fnr family transcriptional regulator [Xanthobacter autotrophicus]MDI4663427.1 Crp/Fnr family transcriptional regulator [Xanthobacter autotrophicus]
MKHVALSEAWTGVADCKNCTIRNAVLFAGLKETDFDALHRPIDQIVYPAGAQIYGTGDEAKTLFTVRSGLVKLTQYLPDGTQRIVRLLHQTDLFGLEALIEDAYPHTATALHDTELCRLPVDVVRDLSRASSGLYHELMARWHRALSSADRWITEFSTGSSRDRVVRLLLWLSEPEDGGRCALFSREDLGAVLGLTTETASRTMAELKRHGFISEPKPNQIVCDTVRLRRLVDG